ncbi:hypothetical protein WMF30_03360 [Sorangium sp. So ce134]
MGHPAFHTGVVHVEPDLRDEVEAYWKAYAAWERTRQGPPPRAPSVSVRVDHEGKPTEAAGLRQAVAKKGGGKGDAEKSAGEKSAAGKGDAEKSDAEKSDAEKSDAEKSAGGNAWAGDEAAAAVIDKSALPPTRRPGSAAAEKKDEAAAGPRKARRAGTAVAALALAAGIGAAAMCGAKERVPAQNAAARGAESGAAKASGAPMTSNPAAGGATADAASEAAAVVESAAESAPHEAAVERAAPTLKPDPLETVRGAASSAVDPAVRRPPAPRKTVKSPEQASENKPEPAGTAEPPAAAIPAPTDLFEGTNYR